jgi:hypothetical protein
VAVSRIWQRPGIFLSQDVAFRVTRIWPHRTFGPRADGRGSVKVPECARAASHSAMCNKSWRGQTFCQGISDHFVCAKGDKFNNIDFD